eukprot:gene19144-biopygen3988
MRRSGLSFDLRYAVPVSVLISDAQFRSQLLPQMRRPGLSSGLTCAVPVSVPVSDAPVR